MSLTELTGNPRHDQLLMLIAERGYMNIDELANLLDVSTQTVRRDIRKLSDITVARVGLPASLIRRSSSVRFRKPKKKKRLPKRWQTIFLMVQQYLSPLVRPLSMLPGRYLTITICG